MMPGMVANWEEDYCKEGTMYTGKNYETPEDLYTVKIGCKLMKERK